MKVFFSGVEDHPLLASKARMPNGNLGATLGRCFGIILLMIPKMKDKGNGSLPKSDDILLGRTESNIHGACIAGILFWIASFSKRV